jgi:hypothetical protein
MRYASLPLALALFSSMTQAVELNEQWSVNGTLEAEYQINHSQGKTENGGYLSTAALGTNFKPNEKLELTGSLLYEEALTEVATPLEVDEAYATWHALPNDKLAIRLGKKYVPFGRFESKMLSDPLTLELGETRTKKTLQVNHQQGAISTAAYLFQGTAPKLNSNGKHKQGYGASLRYEHANIQAGLDYISNLGQAHAWNTARSIPGAALHATKHINKLTLSAEHLTALKTLQAGDLEQNGDGGLASSAKPSATHLEASLGLNKDRNIAIALNHTQQAAALDLPKQAYGITYQQPVFKKLNGGIELMHNKDYENIKSKSLTLQIAYEF